VCPPDRGKLAPNSGGLGSGQDAYSRQASGTQSRGDPGCSFGTKSKVDSATGSHEGAGSMVSVIEEAMDCAMS
jgi:hypothetical protein